ncbi:MAG: Vitamin B12 transporter BtuB [Pseudomonadales bacterium]|nr:Vitamin B12 transporter BtuB [Pseudomonadales bacterium]
MRDVTIRPRRSVLLLQAAIAGSLLGSYAVTASAQESSATDSLGLDEIVVTAQRREENLQDVSVAISAFDGDALRQQNITSAFDIVGKVPGVMVSTGAGPRNAEVVVIRGQGQTYLSSVGVVNYFAEVPLIQGTIQPTQGGPGTFFDLESLQVLRGPQGTLFGRNTTGGAVLLGPKKPGEDFEGYVQAQAGNYDDREYEAAVNVPLVAERLMVRAAYKDVSRDGFTRDVGPQAFGYDTVCDVDSGDYCGFGNPTGAGYAGKDYDNKDWWHGRVSVLWRPTDAIENNLIALRSKSDDNGTGIIFDGAGPGPNVANLVGNMAYDFTKLFSPATMFDPTITQSVLARQEQLGERKVAMNTDQFYSVEHEAYIDTLSVEFCDTLTFRNILSYQEMKIDYNWDLDGSILPMLSQQSPYVPANVNNNPFGSPGTRGNVSDSSQLTEEAQLIGKAFDERLDYVAGIYYAKLEPEGFQATGSFNAATEEPGLPYAIEITSKAVYAQGTLQLGLLSGSLEAWKLTVGLRYTEDETEGSRFSNRYRGDRIYTDPNTYTIQVRSETLKSDEPTWTVGLDYDLNDSTMLYGKVTHGYKAGGFNYAGVGGVMTYEPELVTNYELGVKTDFDLGGMPARVNANVFHLDYEDLQRAAGNNAPIGSFVNGVCTGPNGENFADVPTCLDQGAITFNAEQAWIRGIELEAMIRPTGNFDLSASYSYLDGEYDDFELTVQPDPLRGGFVVNTCNGAQTVPFIGQASFVADLSCIPMQNIPEHTAALTARYTLALGDGAGDVVLLANWSYRGKVYTSATTHPKDDPGAWLDGYDVLNLSAEWNGVLGSNVDLRAFVNNATDETYAVYSYIGLQQSSGFVNSTYGEPRMYGVSLRYRFGALGG